MEETEGCIRLTVGFEKQDARSRVLMTKHIIDERTIEACQHGDSDAFRLVFETYKDRVYSMALCFFDGNEAAAKDITQEVFLKLMTSISQFQNRSQFTTWLYRLVTNACLDRKRALRRFFYFAGSHELDFPDWRRSAEANCIQSEIEKSVRKVIAGMTPKLRMAVLLKYFEDLSYDEIAAVLGCSKGTVASRLNRAHQILARKLSHLRGAFAAACCTSGSVWSHWSAMAAKPSFRPARFAARGPAKAQALRSLKILQRSCSPRWPSWILVPGDRNARGSLKSSCASRTCATRCRYGICFLVLTRSPAASFMTGSHN
jgi:RNA polymerase sigma-70 factor (ECF subfamily)